MNELRKPFFIAFILIAVGLSFAEDLTRRVAVDVLLLASGLALSLIAAWSILRTLFRREAETVEWLRLYDAFTLLAIGMTFVSQGAAWATVAAAILVLRELDARWPRKDAEGKGKSACEDPASMPPA